MEGQSFPSGWARRSELDHGAASHRDIVGDPNGSALGQMERRVLFVIDVLGRRAVDRNDDLVAALRRARSRADGRALERVAADDHGLDAGLLESGLQSGPHEFVGPPWRYHSPARGLIAESMMSS